MQKSVSVKIRKASEVSKEERFKIAKEYLAMNDRQNLAEYNRLVDHKARYADLESEEFDEIDLRMDLLMYS